MKAFESNLSSDKHMVKNNEKHLVTFHFDPNIPPTANSQEVSMNLEPVLQA